MMGQSDGDFILWDKTIMEPPPRPENPLHTRNQIPVVGMIMNIQDGE